MPGEMSVDSRVSKFKFRMVRLAGDRDVKRFADFLAWRDKPVVEEVAPITPHEFAAQMEAVEANFGVDAGTLRGEADKLIHQTLRSLGYAEGLETYTRWELW